LRLGFKFISSNAKLTRGAVLDLLDPLPVEIPGGEIIRDPGLGVLCDAALTLVENITPNKTDEERISTLKLAFSELTSAGLVGVHDAGVFPDIIRLYHRLLL
jgi:predicted amidohydrolase YtcJ